MQLNNDYQKFAQHWLSCCEASANPNRPSDTTLSIIFHDLMQFPLEWVLFALAHHRRNNRFSPVVADIIQIVKDHSGQNHMLADEAWNLALASFDETKTVVWTKEIAVARAEASSVYAEAGKIQAWKTFKAAYERILKTTHTAPIWELSLGTDKTDRVHAVEQAVLKKQLPVSRLEALKIEHKQPEVDFLQLVYIKLAETDKNAAKANLGVLKGILFAKDKTDFESELAIFRQNGKNNEANEIAESAKNLNDAEIGALATRLKHENNRIAHEKLIKAENEKLKERMTPAQIIEFEEILRTPHHLRNRINHMVTEE